MNADRSTFVLSKCFSGSKEHPKRLLKTEPSLEKAEAHLSKAETNLHAMNLLHGDKSFDWTVVTAYYAMYHAVMSVLWLIGLEARSHQCAIAAFEAFYVKKNNVPKEYLAYLDKTKALESKYLDSLEQVRTYRVKASYGLGEIHSMEAKKIATEAKEFVLEMKKIIYRAKGVDIL